MSKLVFALGLAMMIVATLAYLSLFYPPLMRKQHHRGCPRVPLTAKIIYHTEAASPVEQAHDGEWFDLRAAYLHKFKKGESGVIDLGVSIKTPAGYEAILAPRSSTFKKYGLIQTNGIGVIDNKYCGDGDVWKMPVIAFKDIEIPPHTRIAQFRIQKQQKKVILKEVKTMGDTAENRGGFGSTGTT